MIGFVSLTALPHTIGGCCNRCAWHELNFRSVNYSVPANETLTLRSNLTDLDDVKLSQRITGSFVLDVSSNSTQKEGLLMVALRGGEPAPVSACLMRTNDGWGLAISVRTRGRFLLISHYNVHSG